VTGPSASLPKLAAAGLTATWIGLRYLRTQRRQFLSLITWISIAGLGLGVAMLVVVLSVMNGFDAELKRRILGLVPHVVVSPPRDADDRLTARESHSLSDAGPAFRFFQGDGMVTRNGAVHAVAIYGISPEGFGALDVLVSSMRAGRLENLEDVPGGLVMGAPLARHLGLALGDPVTLVFSVPHEDTVLPRLERFSLAGVFEVGADLDYGLVMIAFDEIEKRHLSRAGEIGIRIVIEDPLEVDALLRTIAPRVPAGWTTRDWRRSYGELFRAVRLEKGMMFLLLLLIVAIAAFNIVSAQTMLVNDKRADIAILRTMGASDGLIARMVLMQGLVVAALGIGAGLCIGLLLATNVTESVGLLESVIGARLLDGTYFDEIPVLILPSDLLLVVALSLALCLLSALHPARRAAALNPAEALHEA